jgi:hypothetical protein
MNMDLLEFKRVVAKDRLQHQVTQDKIDCKHSSMDEMYEALCKQSKRKAEFVFADYQFAGKTSVNIFEAINFPKELNNKQAFLKRIKHSIGISDNIAMGMPLKPKITEVPQINLIKDIGDDLLIQWVSGKPRLERDNYGIVERLVPEFETMIVRFGTPFFVQLRSGFTYCRRYLSLLESYLSNEKSQVIKNEWLPLTKVTEKEAEEIAKILNAGLLESEHLGEGCIGKFSVSAAPDIEDLKLQQQYKDMVLGKAYVAQTMSIDYLEVDTGYSTKVKFRINHNGGFEFKSKVSEKIISRIIDVFVEVRYLQKVSGE